MRRERGPGHHRPAPTAPHRHGPDTCGSARVRGPVGGAVVRLLPGPAAAPARGQAGPAAPAAALPPAAARAPVPAPVPAPVLVPAAAQAVHVRRPRPARVRVHPARSVPAVGAARHAAAAPQLRRRHGLQLRRQQPLQHLLAAAELLAAAGAALAVQPPAAAGAAAGSAGAAGAAAKRGGRRPAAPARGAARAAGRAAAAATPGHLGLPAVERKLPGRVRDRRQQPRHQLLPEPGLAAALEPAGPPGRRQARRLHHPAGALPRRRPRGPRPGRRQPAAARRPPRRHPVGVVGVVLAALRRPGRQARRAGPGRHRHRAVPVRQRHPPHPPGRHALCLNTCPDRETSSPRRAAAGRGPSSPEHRAPPPLG